jgi:hypothetical protein
MPARLHVLKTGGPPRKLGKHGAELWRAINHEYAIVDAGGVEMLAHACAALDSAEAFAEQIKQDGLMVRTKTGTKEHPLIRHELAARAFVVKTLKTLGLDVEALKSVGRPAGAFNTGG